MKVFISLDREEIQERIPYSIICETMGGSRWNTGTRRRAWVKEFTEQERRKCGELYKMAYDWYLRHGVPESVKMRPDTLQLWKRLADFCYQL